MGFWNDHKKPAPREACKCKPEHQTYLEGFNDALTLARESSVEAASEWPTDEWVDHSPTPTTRPEAARRRQAAAELAREQRGFDAKVKESLDRIRPDLPYPGAPQGATQ